MKEQDEDKLLREVALQNVQSILLARQRAEEELVRAKEALERKTQELARSLAMMGQSEQRFRSLVAAMTSIVWTTDEAGRFVTEQPSWAAYTGQTWDECRDFGWANALHPDDRDRVRSLWEAAWSSGTVYNSDGRLWHAASGAYRHFEARGVPLRNADGSVREWVGMCVDVEERKQGATFLQLQKQVLEMIVQGSPLTQVLNALARAMESQSQQKMMAAIHLLDEEGTRFQHAIAPSLPESYRRATEGVDVHSKFGSCCLAVLSGQSVTITDVTADPQWNAFAAFTVPLGIRSAWSTPIFSAKGKILGTFANYNPQPRNPDPQELQVVDILTRTVALAIERTRAEEALQESVARFRFMAESMPQKIFTAKPNGDVDYFNPQWIEFTGLSFEQIRDWGWTQFIHPYDVAENVRVWQHSVDTGEPFQFEHRFRRADGEYRWHLSRAVAFRDDGGKVLMWVGSNTDIHEQKQTANELRKLAAELSDADRRKNEFLAMLAHELRNLLAPIRNALEIVRRTEGNGEAVRSASAMMERQVGQMVRLVDDLLDVSRISRGTIDLRRERIELASAVHHAVEAARPLCERMDHELTVALPPKPIYLNADPIRLAQVVGNLLTNAGKFTEKGGRISLTVERKGEQAVIRVQDTGIGIAAEQLSRIFEMFTQLDTSLERPQGGLGIGLTLVKNLVEMHGGTVEVHSAGLGQGSEFMVRLPFLVETPKPLPEPTASEPKPTTARRILVVDDNRDAAESLTMLLKLTGHETQAAYDGLEAVEAAAAFRPDVVLLDIGLPHLNGYEAARKIREQPRGQGMVLVALTGWGQDEDRQKSRDAGFDAHLVKPVDLAALMKLLAV